MESKRTYLEDHNIVLPNIVDGPTAIGDLWDCQQSKLVGLNLFGKKLEAQHLQVTELKDLKYELSHVQSTKDRYKPLQVSGEVALELLSGIIKADGVVEHESDELSYVSEELLCHYDLKTFFIKALSSAKEVMDEMIVEKVVKGHIKATHVVLKMVLGAEVVASIQFRELKSNSKDVIKELLFGKVRVEPVSASAKVVLSELDIKGEDFQLQIKLNSNPLLDSHPTTVSELFQFTEVMNKTIEEKKLCAFLDTQDFNSIKIYGCPLRFYMVPIKELFDTSVDRVYMKIKDDVVERIIVILETLIDLQLRGYLKKQILKAEPCLKKVLLNDKNSLVCKITKREREIQMLAKKHYFSFAETFKDYKIGKCNQDQVVRLSNIIEKDINIPQIMQEVQELACEGQKELLLLYNIKTENKQPVKIFSDSTDLIDWYQTQKPIKVLLHTGGNNVNTGHVRSLLEISGFLRDIGVEVGIATPTVSEGRHDLSIKIDDLEKTYNLNEMSFVINILHLLVSQIDQTTARLFTIYSSLNGVKIPLQSNLTELHSMIEILSEVKEIKVADSHLKLQEFLLEKDGRWKSVIDLNAFDSAADAVEKFRCLNVQLSEIAIDWIVGSYGFECPTRYSNAPLLFIFKNERLQAICFDNVDILLLIEALKSKADSLLELLFPDPKIIKNSCMNKARVDFAFRVIQLFQSKSGILEDESKLVQTEVFSSAVNKNVEAIQILVRSFLGNDNRSLLGAMNNILMMDFPEAETVLKSHMLINDENDFTAKLKNINSKKLAVALKEFLSTQDPFFSKLHLAIESISYLQIYPRKKLKPVQECIKKITDETNCPEELKDQLIACEEIKGNSVRFEKIDKILKKHLETFKGSTLETVALFIKLLEMHEEKLEDFFGTDLLPNLIARLVVDDVTYPNFHTKLLQLSDARNYYVVLHVLAQMQYVETHIFLVSNHLEALSSIRDTEPLCQLLGKSAVDKLSVKHYQWLFANPKMLVLIETNSSSSQLLQTIKFFHCRKSKISDYIPEFLTESLQEMLEEELVECPDIITNIEQAVAIFRKIASQNCVPNNFGKVLGDSVRRSLDFKIALEKANALFYWSEEGQLFTETWNCETIKDAYSHLSKWKHSVDHKQADDEDKVIMFDIELLPEASPLSEIYSDEDNMEKSNDLDRAAAQRTQASTRLLGSYSETIGLKKYLELHSILTEPRIGSTLEEGFIAKLLPYIVQHLKMWGIHVIQQENLVKLNSSQLSIPKSRCFKKFVFGANTSHLHTPIRNSSNSNTSYPIARIDILTCLNTVCESEVFQDLLRVMSQFPIALPLILQDLHNNQWDYVYLVSLLKSICVKWEVRPGVVIHNQLFINPFKMIVALRVGSAKPGCLGKSTILNQILGLKHMFSSLGGPGADKGIPLTLHGSAEMVVLLQETCSYALWESVIKNHYSLGSNEVLMLVNIHGDVLELPETIELLKDTATSFIVFFMPCTQLELEHRSTKLQDMLGDTADVIYILVDPTPDCEGQPTNTLCTNQLTLDDTLETVRSALDAAIHMGSSKQLIPLKNISNGIRPSPNVFAEESELLITHIKHLGCEKAKSILQLQKVNPKYFNRYPAMVMNVWQTEPNFRTLITQFVQVLSMPLKSRLLAFAHLDRELSLLTANASTQVREKLGRFQEQRRRLLNLERGCTLSTQQKKVIEQIRLTMDELDGMSLGIEHLYRELGRIYQASQCDYGHNNESVLSLPKKYAELLIWGHSIEILDGDIGDICGPWLNSICHSVCESYPDLRIFTLSIIGLQSSGKSTLLNALFACKFAVSVGRCTRGLFMRLIFLDKSLSDELNIDAILLIDTEGLGAPEKLNDPAAEQKDRLLATFVMSISNLTLINVLGESVRDLTDILQIVIVTMARLEKADISPDILMVQHLSERDTSKTMKGADEFCKALEEAVSLTDSKDMAIGVRNSNSLRKLEHRVKNGQLLKQFRSFKNGASANAPPSQEYHEDVVDLYKTILNSCKQVTSPQKFHNWHELIQNYWAAVSSQDFSLRFKNIQEVHEFIDRGSAIAKVKQALDSAFRIHKECCETKLRQTVNELADKADGNWEKGKESELQSMRDVLKWIPNSCEPSCSTCSEAVHLKNQLFRDLEGKHCQEETETTIYVYIQKTRESVINHLSQMAEAIQVKHGWSCEFDAVIGSILMEKLKDEPNPSESERVAMANEVWSRVQQQISEKLQVVSAKRRIYDEVKVEYSHINAVSKHFNREMTAEFIPELRYINAVEFTLVRRLANVIKDAVSSKRHRGCLDFKQVTFLESKLDKLSNSVLKKCKTDHFEDGMVSILKEDINKVLQELDIVHIQEGKLLPNFKWKVHVYALLKFVEAMTLKEEEWNKNNNPYYILLQNEDTYRKMIYIRLKHGFGFEAEGRIIAGLLLKAIRKRGQKQGDRMYIDSVRSTSWLSNSENVRLLYFAELARQVEQGDTQQALKHFSNPKAMIEGWFVKQVDSFSPKIGENKFIETVDTELEYVAQEIRNKKTCREIKAFISGYLTQVEDMEYNPGVDLDSASSTDFDFLQKFISRKLDEDKSLLKIGITMSKPSEHSEIISLLGCTEHCKWCGSLCWGQAGHAENMDNTKKHHACHQPEGLIGVSHKEFRHLQSISCDTMGDDWTVYWHKCWEGMRWPDAKLHEDFVNWTFTPHNKEEFNDLMKWFFLKLHEDIANSSGVLPAQYNDLSSMGFFNLVSLDHILATIKSRI